MFILYMGSLFSKKPNFGIAFGIKSWAYKYMEEYGIYSDDLNKENLAQVFIEKILGDTKLSQDDKKWRLIRVRDKIEEMRLTQNSKNFIPEVKKAYQIIEENKKKYILEINEAIKILSPETTSPNPNVAANAANLLQTQLFV